MKCKARGWKIQFIECGNLLAFTSLTKKRHQHLWHFRRLFGTSSVLIPASTPVNLTEDFLAFPQALQNNGGIVQVQVYQRGDYSPLLNPMRSLISHPATPSYATRTTSPQNTSRDGRNKRSLRIAGTGAENEPQTSQLRLNLCTNGPS
jgi:hypothetical protein